MVKKPLILIRLLLVLVVVCTLVAITAAPASAQAAFTNPPAPGAAPVGASVTLNIVAGDGFLFNTILTHKFPYNRYI